MLYNGDYSKRFKQDYIKFDRLIVREHITLASAFCIFLAPDK